MNCKFINYLSSRLEEIFDGEEPEGAWDAEQAVGRVLEEYYEPMENLCSDDAEIYRAKDETIASLV